MVIQAVVCCFFSWLHFGVFVQPISLGIAFSLELWLHLRHLGALLSVSHLFYVLPITVVMEGPICGGVLEHGEFVSAREHLLRREENIEIPSSLSSAAGMQDDDLSTINLKGLHELRLCPAALETNLSLDSVDAAVQELKVARVDNQNNTNLWVIVDCTTSQLGRNPSGLLDISLRTGYHVVSMLYATCTVFIYQFPSVTASPHALALGYVCQL